MLKKVISGAQTGVDRAGLDAALELGLEIGGWCPKGRRSEFGPIPEKYLLKETSGTDYKERTEWNVRDSDATIIIKQGPITPGTRYTISMVSKYLKPLRIIDLQEGFHIGTIVDWLDDFQVINIAGPRESKNPGIHAKAKEVLLDILGKCLDCRSE